MSELDGKVRSFLRRAIKDRGLSIEKVAGNIDLNQSTVSRILNGQQKLTLELISKFSTVLQLSPSAILERSENKDYFRSDDLENLVLQSMDHFLIWQLLWVRKRPEQISRAVQFDPLKTISFLQILLENELVNKNLDGTYELSELGRRLKIGRNPKFYTGIKRKIFEHSLQHTSEVIANQVPEDQRADQEDAHFIRYLTREQAEYLKKRFSEYLKKELDALDSANRESEKINPNINLNASAYTVFFTQKPFDAAILEKHRQSKLSEVHAKH